MVKALRALPGERRAIALKPWLFRVAHNEAVGILRARRSSVELDPEQIDIGGGVAERAETRERLERLVGDLDTPPERQRGALIMRELNGVAFARSRLLRDLGGRRQADRLRGPNVAAPDG